MSTQNTHTNIMSHVLERSLIVGSASIDASQFLPSKVVMVVDSTVPGSRQYIVTALPSGLDRGV